MKKIIRSAAWAVGLALVWGGAVWAMGDKPYFANKNVTPDQLMATWGRPYQTVTREDGSTIMVFDRRSDGLPYRNRYFVIRDGRVVDGGTNYGR